MKISIADLSERISVVSQETIHNEYGDIIKVKDNVRCMIWANVYPISAKIADVTPERQNQINYRVIIRRRADILPDDEILWRDRRLKIISPPYDLDGRREFTCLNCTEVLADGAAST